MAVTSYEKIDGLNARGLGPNVEESWDKLLRRLEKLYPSPYARFHLGALVSLEITSDGEGCTTTLSRYELKVDHSRSNLDVVFEHDISAGLQAAHQNSRWFIPAGELNVSRGDLERAALLDDEVEDYLFA